MIATLDQMDALLNQSDTNSPFLLDNEGAYRAWRTRKLAGRRNLSPMRVFSLDRNGLLPVSDFDAVKRQIAAFNFICFEATNGFDKAHFLALNRQFGLHQPDANLGADADQVTSLRVVDSSDARAQYIPYTNRALNWHTDGYYNPHQRRICAFALYCVHQAARGGGNFLFDHEWMYLLIRDRAPDLLAALMCDDMLRVPANLQGRRVVRDEETGPVFAPRAHTLCMRFSSRPRNIVWKADKRSERALNLIREILVDGEAAIELRLRPRQGLICNNILHGREAFHDGQPARLIYRARYRDAIDLDKR